ncbi:GNAT family N-acetyltransferase [Sphingomonas sp.]|uniref:GNAT family N-acetyltransferase n=1 Tax=Sphingomonas sp. TaxID=28214 RepID=UPI00286AFCEE|nr:GNAT family N-acetyltransferase [Sphingomonas sp.]
MIRSAPRLETERLILRDFTRDDLDALAATLSDVEVVRHLTGEPISREDSLRRLFMAVGQWPLTGMGMWAVEQKSDGRMVGHVGFFDMERDIIPSITGLPEMGWIFDTAVHGQGIAHEACLAALAWLDATHGPIDVPAIISAENVASLKLAKKLGFLREPDGVYKGEPIAMVRRPAPLA